MYCVYVVSSQYHSSITNLVLDVQRNFQQIQGTTDLMAIS